MRERSGVAASLEMKKQLALAFGQADDPREEACTIRSGGRFDGHGERHRAKVRRTVQPIRAQRRPHTLAQMHPRPRRMKIDPGFESDELGSNVVGAGRHRTGYVSDGGDAECCHRPRTRPTNPRRPPRQRCGRTG